METSVYGTLFLAAFLAATILPAQSEAVLLTFAASGNYPLWAILTVASVGNVLGAVVNWWLGGRIEHFRHRDWFPVNEMTLTKAQGWYGRYGRWSLLLSWVPVIGDPLTMAAGVMKERFISFLAMVTLAKTGRYLFLVAVLENLP